jgi:hypothetical protein
MRFGDRQVLLRRQMSGTDASVFALNSITGGGSLSGSPGGPYTVTVPAGVTANITVRLSLRHTKDDHDRCVHAALIRLP